MPLASSKPFQAMVLRPFLPAFPVFVPYVIRKISQLRQKVKYPSLRCPHKLGYLRLLRVFLLLALTGFGEYLLHGLQKVFDRSGGRGGMEQPKGNRSGQCDPALPPYQWAGSNGTNRKDEAVIGKRKQPFGYKIEFGDIVPDLEETEVVRSIYLRYLAGASFNQLASNFRRRIFPMTGTSLGIKI